MRGLLLLAAATYASAQLPAPYCLDVVRRPRHAPAARAPRPNPPPRPLQDSSVCISWLVTGANITFSMTCNPPDAVLSWCALAFSRDKSGSMAPADVTMLSVSPAAPTVVVLEDRNSTSYAAPACAAAPASTLLSSAVNADTSVTATWTRELVPGNGAAPIVNGFTFVLAAISSAATGAAFQPCYTVGMPQHDFQVAKIPLNLFDAPPSV